jgi:lysophospholipase L1-like esterase
MMPASVLRKRLLRATICVLIFVGSWECCARVEEWTQRGIPPLAMRYVAPQTYRYDARGLHGIASAVDGKYRMDSLGYRGPEVTTAKPIVLCLGASETYGIYESPEKEFPRQLQRVLAARRENVQVVNAALPGARPEDTERTLRVALTRFEPKIVTLYFSPSAVIWTKREWDDMHRSYESRNPPDEVTQRLRITGQVRDLILSNLPESMKRRRAESTMRKAIARAHVIPAGHLPEANFREFRRALHSILSILDRRHVAVVLITHADRFGNGAFGKDNDADEVSSFRTFYPKLTLAGLADTEHRMNAVIAAEAATHHAGLADAAHTIAPGPANFADFFHFTDRGSAEMATLLADKIKPQLN